MSEEVDVGDDVAALLDIIRGLMADIKDLKRRTTTAEYSLRGQIEWRDLLKAQTMEALDEAKADIRELKSAVRWLEEEENP